MCFVLLSAALQNSCEHLLKSLLLLTTSFFPFRISERSQPQLFSISRAHERNCSTLILTHHREFNYAEIFFFLVIDWSSSSCEVAKCNKNVYQWVRITDICITVYSTAKWCIRVSWTIYAHGYLDVELQNCLWEIHSSELVDSTTGSCPTHFIAKSSRSGPRDPVDLDCNADCWPSLKFISYWEKKGGTLRASTLQGY